MKFAFQTIIWGRHIHDLELVLEIIAACGYTGVEFAQRPKDIRVRDEGRPGGFRPIHNIDELLSLLAVCGLTLVSLAGGSLRERIEFCGPSFRPEYLYVDDFGDAEKKVLDEITSEVARTGTRPKPFAFGLHPHWFMTVQRWSQAIDILKRHRQSLPNGHCLRLLPDTAHLTIAGDDPVKAVQNTALDDLAAVHLKDWTPGYGRYSHRYAQGFVPLGNGIVPLEGVLAELKRKAFDGWVIVEQDAAAFVPAQAAMECAQWLAKQDFPIKPSKSVVGELVRREVEVRKRVPILDHKAKGELKLLRAMLQAETRGISCCYQSVVDTFMELGGLDAAKLYSYYPRTEELYLLAAAGLPECPCEKVIKKRDGEPDNLLMEVVTNKEIVSFDLTDSEKERRFRDKDFLGRLTGKKMRVVPVFNPSNTHHLRFLLVLFPKTDDDWCDEGELAHLGEYVARIVDHVGDEICAAAATLTSYHCAHSRTKEQFLKKLVELITDEIDCEAMSILLQDETGTELRLAVTTGIEWNPSLKSHEQCYHKGDGLTGKTWKDGEMRLVSNASGERQLDRSSRKISWEINRNQDRSECLFAPLGRLGGEVFGVIRLVNKSAVPNSRAATVFTDDDAAKLDAIIQSALPYLELLNTQHHQAVALSRLNHELQNPLSGTKWAADLLREKLKMKGITDLKSELGADYLDEIAVYQQFMSRLALNATLFGSGFDQLKPEFDIHDLGLTVVEPVARQLRPLLTRYGLPEDRITVDKFQSIIPPIYVDMLMMQQVFFNLLTNAIKYHDQAQDFRIHVKGGCESLNGLPQHYFIDVEDWGIGLDSDPDSPERMFLPGVRGAEVSKEKDVSGTGIGLSLVRDIIMRHGGTVAFAPNADAQGKSRDTSIVKAKEQNLYRKPTRIRIALPLSLREAKPCVA